MVLAPRPPAVAKPKVGAIRKSVPKEVAAKPEGKAKFWSKGRTVLVMLVSHLFFLLRVVDRRWSRFAASSGTRWFVAASVSCAKSCESSSNSRAVPPIVNGVPPGFALPAFHGGLHPARL